MPKFAVFWPGLPAASLTTYSNDDAAVVVATEAIDPGAVTAFPVDQVYTVQSVPALLRPSDDDHVDEIGGSVGGDVLDRDGPEIQAFFVLFDPSAAIALEVTLGRHGWNTEAAAVRDELEDRPATRITAGKTITYEALGSDELQALRAWLEEQAEAHGGFLDGWELEL